MLPVHVYGESKGEPGVTAMPLEETPDGERFFGSDTDSTLFKVYRELKEVLDDSWAAHPDIGEDVQGLNDALLQFVLIGTQSAGKTSLLEQILGFPAGFKHHDTGTRAPVQYTLKRSKESETALKVTVDGRHCNPVDLPSIMKTKMEEIQRGPGFRQHPVKVTVEGPALVDLVVTDLPGMKTDDGEKQSIQNILASYVANRDTNLLVVVPHQDKSVGNLSWGVIKDFLDTQDRAWRSRTIFVVTKCDEQGAIDSWENYTKEGRHKFFEDLKNRKEKYGEDVRFTACRPYCEHGTGGIPTSSRAVTLLDQNPEELREYLRNCKHRGYEDQFWDSLDRTLTEAANDGGVSVLSSIRSHCGVQTVLNDLQEQWRRRLTGRLVEVERALRNIRTSTQRKIASLKGLAALENFDQLKSMVKDLAVDAAEELIYIFHRGQSQYLPDLLHELGSNFRQEYSAVMVDQPTLASSYHAPVPSSSISRDQLLNLLDNIDRLFEDFETKLKGTELFSTLENSMLGSAAVGRALQVSCYLLLKRAHMVFTPDELISWAGYAHDNQNTGRLGPQAFQTMVARLSQRACRLGPRMVHLMSKSILKPLPRILHFFLGNKEKKDFVEYTRQETITRERIRKQQEEEFARKQEQLEETTQQQESARTRHEEQLKEIYNADIALSKMRELLDQVKESRLRTEDELKKLGEETVELEKRMKILDEGVDVEKIEKKLRRTKKHEKDQKDALAKLKKEYKKLTNNCKMKENERQILVDETGEASELRRLGDKASNLRRTIASLEEEIKESKTHDMTPQKEAEKIHRYENAKGFGRHGTLQYVNGVYEVVYEIISAEIALYATKINEEWERIVSRAFHNVDYAALDQAFLQLIFAFSRSNEAHQSQQDGKEDVLEENCLKNKGVAALQKSPLMEEEPVVAMVKALPPSIRGEKLDHEYKLLVQESDTLHSFGGLEVGLELAGDKRRLELSCIVNLLNQFCHSAKKAVDDKDLVTADLRKCPDVNSMTNQDRAIKLFSQEAHEYYHEVMSFLVPQFRWLVNSDLTKRVVSNDSEGFLNRVKSAFQGYAATSDGGRNGFIPIGPPEVPSDEELKKRLTLRRHGKKEVEGLQGLLKKVDRAFHSITVIPR